jgi:hypothetical protein
MFPSLFLAALAAINLAIASYAMNPFSVALGVFCALCCIAFSVDAAADRIEEIMSPKETEKAKVTQ